MKIKIYDRPVIRQLADAGRNIYKDICPDSSRIARDKRPG